MNNLSSLLDKEVIDWPFELKPIHLVPGNDQIGDCWKVACFTDQMIKALETELRKRRRQLEHYENHLEKLIQQSNTQSQHQYDEMGFLDVDGEISQMDILITKLRQRITDIEAELNTLNSKYNNDHDSDSEDDHRHKKKDVKKDRQKNKSEDFVVCYAKLVLNPFVIRNNNCINEKHISNTLDYQVDAFIKEFELIKESLQNYWIDISKKEGAVEILCIDKIVRKREPFINTPTVLYVTKQMINGSVMNYLTNLPNKNDIFQLDDSLIFNNMKKQISLLNYLEKNRISHNNIKPNNVLISEDGHNLLLSDFCPETLFIERCFKAQTGKMNIKFTSPEYTLLLTNDITFHSVEMSNKLIEEINDKVGRYDFPDKVKYFVHKNDVFCLGLIYYYLLTLKIPSANDELVYEDVISELKDMMKTRDHDILDLVIRMLEFSPFTRNSWEELLESLEK